MPAFRSPRPARVLAGALVVASLTALAALPAHAAGAATEEIAVPPGGPGSVALTILGGATAVVREIRSALVPAGESVLAFPDVPDAADAASVRLAPADGGGGLTVLERALAADVPSLQRLLALSVGREIGVLLHDQGEGAPPRRVPATVVSVAEDVVLEMEGRIHVGLPGEPVFDALPPELRATPTLLATVDSAAAGARDLALTYLTGGLAWRADYTLDLTGAADRAALSGWATVTNTSGRSFRGARLTLAAGEVAVETDKRGGGAEATMMRADMAMAAPMPPVPEAEAQGGLHFYPVERPVSLAHRQTRQVALVDAPDVAVTPRHVVPPARYGVYANAQVDDETVNARRQLVLRNTAEDGLGRPLPAGTVRVWQPGPDGAPRFLGADRTPHVAVGGEAALDLGTDFDVTAERRRTDFRRIGERVTETDHEIVVRNAKPERAVSVTVEAELPGEWTILDESHPHARVNAGRVAWTMEVPADGETRLTYSVRTRF
ncbi:DUF4139 domain-containing protein [Roseospira goensis]|uniref:DUF4139 domain-containing protein n=1 Tax=Roseospira goensis TaxID=391922 RepID=A0A7W6RYQ7_9PROT|nr:DUF4139 domain-containing protein [Roseospira goensis]MBB4285506.1 hypothetical protein [Roseospira goensis]